MKQMPPYDLIVYCDAPSHAEVQLGKYLTGDKPLVLPEGVYGWPYTRIDGSLWFNASDWHSGKTLKEMDSEALRGKDRIRRRGGKESLAPVDGSVIRYHANDGGRTVYSDIEHARQDAGFGKGEALREGSRYSMKCQYCDLPFRGNGKKTEALFDTLLDNGVVGISLQELIDIRALRGAS